MKNHDFRNIDELGRVVLPRGLREDLALKAGDTLEVYLENGKIVLSPQVSRCKLCGTAHELDQVNEFTICKSCINIIAKSSK